MNTSARLAWSLLLLALATAPALAWDPYDAARGNRGAAPTPGDYRAPTADYRFRPTETEEAAVPLWRRPDQGRRWQAQQPWSQQASPPANPPSRPPGPFDPSDRPDRCADWSADWDRSSDWGRSDRRFWTDPAESTAPRPDAGVGPSMDPSMDPSMAPATDPGVDPSTGTWPGPAVSTQGYRFRTDPKLDAISGNQDGYRYRPLTAREAERNRRQGPSRYREQDLQPRGPWRSYEDHGTAFGYHPEDHGGPETSPYELR